MFAAVIFVFSQLALAHQRHNLRTLESRRDALRAGHQALLDENRNLQLEQQILFNPMDLPKTAKQLGMREPSFADGTLVFLRR